MSDIFGGEDETPIEPEQPQEETPLAAEAEAEAPEPAKEEPKDDPTVPLSALNEARFELRQTQNELTNMRQQMEQFKTMKEELDEWRSRTRQASEEDEFNTDPLGTLQKQIKGIDERLSQQKQEDLTQQEQAQREQQLVQAISSQVAEFKKQTPDYDQALQYVLETRKKELLTIGVPEAHAQQRIIAEAQEIGMNALNSGQNAGKLVYDLATHMGYKAKQAAAKLEVIDKGQKNSSSLSESSGNAGDSGFSLREIDSMSDDEFDAFWEREMKPNHR